eukprot:TRINITY_DN28549_c1_g1_i2.p5 TRINITY_DN28549_c1_g1~~TRINITY_DN28549_c1_g1_i2.p5  ORF type:complete len:217 (-),score=-13.09 TRINITY_DN28549_c1_g1_i2:283-933(-)
MTYHAYICFSGINNSIKIILHRSPKPSKTSEKQPKTQRQQQLCINFKILRFRQDGITPSLIPKRVPNFTQKVSLLLIPNPPMQECTQLALTHRQLWANTRSQGVSNFVRAMACVYIPQSQYIYVCTYIGTDMGIFTMQIYQLSQTFKFSSKRSQATSRIYFPKYQSSNQPSNHSVLHITLPGIFQHQHYSAMLSPKQNIARITLTFHVKYTLSRDV